MKMRKGFTIIELLMSMTFLATMLIGIAAITMRIVDIYQKGLALRSVNSTGREIISDLTRTVGASRVFLDINPVISDNKIELAQIKAARADYYLEKAEDSKQLGGVFCTGDYSYVWNTADNIRKIRNNRPDRNYTKSDIEETGVFAIAVKDSSTYIVPKLARFVDRDRDACAHDKNSTQPSESGAIKDGKYIFDFTSSDYEKNKNDIYELIADNEMDLALYNFTVFPATQHAKTMQIFYSGMFILATIRGGVNIKSNGEFCQGSSQDDGSIDSEFTLNDFNYCAVNKFNFSVRATGETRIEQYGER